MKKNLVIASVLVAALSATAAYAGHGGKDCDRGYSKWGHVFGMGHHKGAKMMEREFNADQIRTLMEARLIIKGNDNLKVGKISSSRNGFTVAIITRDDSLVDELQLAKNGMPVEMYERMKARMEKRKTREDKE